MMRPVDRPVNKRILFLRLDLKYLSPCLYENALVFKKSTFIRLLSVKDVAEQDANYRFP